MIMEWQSECCDKKQLKLDTNQGLVRTDNDLSINMSQYWVHKIIKYSLFLILEKTDAFNFINEL